MGIPKPRPIFLAIASTGTILFAALSLELCFRLWGPRPTSFIDSQQLLAVREASGPFFRVKWKGFRRYLVQVPQHYAYVPPQVFPLKKEPGKRRILVLGESSAVALGRAFLSGIERASLSHMFEVMNCGVPGGTLEEMGHRFRETVGYSPDLLVIMFGHNLFYASQSMHPWVFEAIYWARKSWFFSWAAERLPSLPERRTARVERWWLLNRLLERMADEARRRGVPWVACTLPSNLWFPPSAAPHEALDADYLEARFLRLTGRRSEAVQTLRGLLVHRSAALWNFELADWLYQDGDYAAARRHFVASRDGDADRAQASTAVNALIREAVRREGGWLLDADALVTAQAPHGIPGWESFDDEQHVSGFLFDFEATSLFKLLQRNNWPDPSVEWPEPLVGERKRFPFVYFLEYLVNNVRDYENSWARAVAYKVAHDVRHGDSGLKERLEEWVSEKASGAPHSLPDTWGGIVLLRAAEGFWRVGDRAEAWRLNEKVRRSLPGWEEPFMQGGLFFLQERKKEDAARAFRRVLEINPSRSDAEFFLARLKGKRLVVRATTS